MFSFYYYREEGNLLPVVAGRSLALMPSVVLSDGDPRYRPAPFLSSPLGLALCLGVSGVLGMPSVEMWQP